MGMMYSVEFQGVSVAAAQDLFELVAPSDAVLRVHSCRITQNSEEADAQAEQLSVKFVRGEGSVTSGSGGSTPTPAPLASGLPASGATVEANNTTKMVVGTGTLTDLHSEAFNVQIGMFYQPTPEERIDISPSDRMTVELVDAPADAVTMDGVLVFEEIGG